MTIGAEFTILWVMITHEQDRNQLHQRFAEGLGGLIERLTPPSPEPLSDPNTSFYALLHQQRKKFIYFAFNEKTKRYASFEPPPVENSQMNFIITSQLRLNAASESKWFDKESVKAPDRDFVQISYAALNVVKNAWLKAENNPLRRLNGLMVAGLIAANYMPPNYNSPERPKKHKNETVEEEMFRRAMSILFDIKNNVTHENRKFDNVYTAHKGDPIRITELLMKPDNEVLRRGSVDLQIWSYANELIEKLASPDFTPEMYGEEVYELQKWAEKIKKQKSQETQPEPPVEETKWTILPPGTMEQIAKGPIKGESAGKYENAQFVDPDRMKWLAELALSWNPDAYIVVSNLKATGDYDYRAAILPQVKNGVKIEHAVAENPASKNTIYVFRAERGIDDDGSTWLTWKEALSDNRTGAKALGARKIVHNQYVRENVMEYLTRKDEDLDKVGYRR